MFKVLIESSNSDTDQAKADVLEMAKVGAGMAGDRPAQIGLDAGRSPGGHGHKRDESERAGAAVRRYRVAIAARFSQRDRQVSQRGRQGAATARCPFHSCERRAANLLKPRLWIMAVVHVAVFAAVYWLAFNFVSSCRPWSIQSTSRSFGALCPWS